MKSDLKVFDLTGKPKITAELTSQDLDDESSNYQVSYAAEYLDRLETANIEQKINQMNDTSLMQTFTLSSDTYENIEFTQVFNYNNSDEALLSLAIYDSYEEVKYETFSFNSLSKMDSDYLLELPEKLRFTIRQTKDGLEKIE